MLRPWQIWAAEKVLKCEKDTVAVLWAPTGSGKTAVYVYLAGVRGLRTLVLSRTRTQVGIPIRDAAKLKLLPPSSTAFLFSPIGFACPYYNTRSSEEEPERVFGRCIGPRCERFDEEGEDYEVFVSRLVEGFDAEAVASSLPRCLYPAMRKRVESARLVSSVLAYVAYGHTEYLGSGYDLVVVEEAHNLVRLLDVFIRRKKLSTLTRYAKDEISDARNIIGSFIDAVARPSRDKWRFVHRLAAEALDSEQHSENSDGGLGEVLRFVALFSGLMSLEHRLAWWEHRMVQNLEVGFEYIEEVEPPPEATDLPSIGDVPPHMFKPVIASDDGEPVAMLVPRFPIYSLRTLAMRLRRLGRRLLLVSATPPPPEVIEAIFLMRPCIVRPSPTRFPEVVRRIRYVYAATWATTKFEYRTGSAWARSIAALREVVARLRDELGGVAVMVPSNEVAKTVQRHLPGGVVPRTPTEVVEIVQAGGVPIIVARDRNSEGVEFRVGGRQLIRALVVFGVPYPDASDPVLGLLVDRLSAVLSRRGMDRMAILDALAMEAVAQAAGRLARDPRDEALVVLLDYRWPRIISRRPRLVLHYGLTPTTQYMLLRSKT